MWYDKISAFLNWEKDIKFDILIAISFFSLLSNINLIYGIAVTVWFNFIQFSTFDVTLVVDYKWDYKTERIVDIQSNERR